MRSLPHRFSTSLALFGLSCNALSPFHKPLCTQYPTVDRLCLGPWRHQVKDNLAHRQPMPRPSNRHRWRTRRHTVAKPLPLVAAAWRALGEDWPWIREHWHIRGRGQLMASSGFVFARRGATPLDGATRRRRRHRLRLATNNVLPSQPQACMVDCHLDTDYDVVSHLHKASPSYLLRNLRIAQPRQRYPL